MTGNDSAVMKETIDLFLHQLIEARADMDFLLGCKNWGELSRLAHKIKSSALVMGVEQMADEMKELELLAKDSRNVDEYPEYIASLNAMIDLVEVELRPYLKD